MILASTKEPGLHFFSDVIAASSRPSGAVGASTDSYRWATQRLATDERVDDLVSHQFPLYEAQRAMKAAAGLLGHDQLNAEAVTF